MSLTDVERSRHGEIAPCTVNGFFVAVVEAIATAALLLPYLGRRIRRARAREEITLREKLKEVQSALAAFAASEARDGGTEPYR